MESVIQDQSLFSGIIGVSRRDITPPVGIYTGNWGAAQHQTAAGIHRALTLTCITFQSSVSASPLVLIGADLGWWKNGDDELELRQGILKALSLSSAQLLFCLSHTHAGPGLSSDDESKPGGNHIRPYLEYLKLQAIAAAEEALSTAQPASLGWTYGQCGLAVNRDLQDTEKDRLLVGYNPDEPADQTLLIGRITDAEGKVLSTIVNYACHPTTLAWENELISPDYIGAMREMVELETEAPCLFLQGASGELSPPEQYSGDTGLADKYGRQLAYAVLSTLQGMLPAGRKLHFERAVESGAPLALWKQTANVASPAFHYEKVMVALPLKELPSIAEIEQEWSLCSDPVLKERLWRKRGVRKSVGAGNQAQIPLLVWRLGGALIFGQPNEAYSLWQQELRRKFPKNAICVINVANGHIGYLPPKPLYDKNAYAVWQTPFAAGSLELLIKSADLAATLMLNK